MNENQLNLIAFLHMFKKKIRNGLESSKALEGNSKGFFRT